MEFMKDAIHIIYNTEVLNPYSMQGMKHIAHKIAFQKG